MASEVRNSLLVACQTFMEPIARFLMRHGIGFREFSEVAKTAFVKIATDEYGKRGRPTNISRTAVLTGLTRKEVKRIRVRIEEQGSRPPPRLGKPAQLLEIWHHDDHFLDNDGRPRELEMEGVSGFKELAKRTGGDVPPGALLTELINAKSVKEVSDGRFRCLSRHFNPSGIDTYMALRYGEVLGDLASTLDFNAVAGNDSDKRFERRVWSDALDEKRLAKFQQLIRDHGKSLLEFLDDWISAQGNAESTGEQKSTRCGMGMYFFMDDKHPRKKRNLPKRTRS